MPLSEEDHLDKLNKEQLIKLLVSLACISEAVQNKVKEFMEKTRFPRCEAHEVNQWLECE
jgi:hypothetical protein